jgi:pimeloyl-ACP methyl ester carboxylesterase
MQRLVWILLLCLLHFPPGTASDLAREQRLRSDLIAGGLTGEPLTLKAPEDFLAIRLRATLPKSRGAVILAHDMDGNPDENAVIHPLRLDLPDHGWETLSLQMPLTAPDAGTGASQALIAAAAPRLNAALKLLKQEGVKTVAVIGYGLGARMAAAWLGQRPAPEIAAFVAVGMPVGGHGDGGETLKVLAGIKVPILDIFGSRDLEPVTTGARARSAAALRSGNRAYRQARIEGADHGFRDQAPLLQARIRAWLARTAGDKALRTAAGPAL